MAKSVRARNARGQFVASAAAAPGPGSGEPLPVPTGAERRPIKRLTEDAKSLFLETLGQTGNATQAAAAAGHALPNFYHARRRCPAFAGLWQVALARAYETIELMMLRRAMVGLGDETGRPSVAMRRYTDEQAMKLLRMHRETVKGVDDAAARIAAEKAEAATRARLEAKLDLMRRRLTGEAGSAPDDAGG